MTTKKEFLAFDLGAESGRGIIGTLENSKLTLEEVTRFPTGIMHVMGHYHWNIFRFGEALKKSLSVCLHKHKCIPASIGIDTWGVDFSLLAEDGSIIGVPFAYRDARTKGAMEEVFEKITRDRIYHLTGIQFMELNSLYQLYAMKKANHPFLSIAKDLLFIPDTLNYMLTGIKKTEFTFATTSQLFNPVKQEWEKELFDALEVPIGLMQDVVKPGTIIGNLNQYITAETGMPSVPVTAVASHDTASAIVSIPATDDEWAFISSGTWSLMGVENQEPLINDLSSKYNFTNEGGAENTYRFLKNISGLWLLQQCRKAWMKTRTYSYPELVEMCTTAEPYFSFIDVDAPDFVNPADMPAAIADYCKKKGQPVPETHAQIVRVILEGLALKYRHVLDQLKEVTGKKISKIHIIGGGTQNHLLCQFTSNACQLPVVAGPAEATAAGNIMMQALALKEVSSLQEIRNIIYQSFALDQYNPRDKEDWDKAYKNYRNIVL